MNLRQLVIDLAQALKPQNLTVAKSGNVSIANPGTESRYITPSGIPYARLVPDDIVEINIENGSETGRLKASSEKALHIAVARAYGYAVIIHGDAKWSSLVMEDILPITHDIFHIGDKIPFAPYATPGSEEIANGAVRAMHGGYPACILGQHGYIACGKDAEEALERAVWVEHLSETWLRHIQYCVQTGQRRKILPRDEIARLKEMFQSYGKQR